MALHEHTYQGQTLRHDHDGGSVPHAYFGHAEDYPRQPVSECEYRDLSGDPADNCEGQTLSDILASPDESDWTDEDEEAGYCTVEHPCPQRYTLGHGHCVHTV